MIPIDSSYDNDRAVKELPSCVQDHRTLLFVGAGSSAFVGYPRWKRLLKMLHDKLAPGVELTGNYLNDAQALKGAIPKERIRDYHQFLRDTFRPQAGSKGYDQFHEVLCSLPVCGVATTNYDCVMERAIAGTTGCSVDYTDLCNVENYRYRLLPQLRRFAAHDIHRDKLQDVLHLHGYYDYPRGILLTSEEYRQSYGPMKVKDDLGRTSDGVLDTLHRKVAWSLLTNYHIFFVGFSLSDPYFAEVLDIAKMDLDLGDRKVHSALVGMKACPGESSSERKQRLAAIAKEWARYGIMPVFFDVRSNPATGKEDDYLTGQAELLQDTLERLGIAMPRSRGESWSDVMVSRVRNEN